MRGFITYKNTEEQMLLCTKRKITEFKNLDFNFLIARCAEKMPQKSPKETTQYFHEQHRYFSKETNQFIYLTKKQHQYLQLYNQYKNIKSVACNMSFAERTAEEHLKLVRKKFQMQKLAVLISVIDQRLVEYVDQR